MKKTWLVEWLVSMTDGHVANVTSTWIKRDKPDRQSLSRTVGHILRKHYNTNVVITFINRVEENGRPFACEWRQQRRQQRRRAGAHTSPETSFFPMAVSFYVRKPNGLTFYRLRTHRTTNVIRTVTEHNEEIGRLLACERSRYCALFVIWA